jgi:hypothetical protein
LYFLHILEFYLISENLKEMKTQKNSRTVLGRHFGHGPELLSWSTGRFGLAGPSRRRGVLARSLRAVHTHGGVVACSPVSLWLLVGN